mmetsp:Transcript_5289/g.11623  ORF Transcript_5289/g.11623 Transcript_5289/m.11623 type:complete len:92 (-) Transcript_5289:8-283(-)
MYSQPPFTLRVCVPSHKIALEIGRRADFVLDINQTRVEWLPFVAFRHRLLRSRGWEVVPVPFYDLQNCKDVIVLERFLRRKISPVISALRG